MPYTLNFQFLLIKWDVSQAPCFVFWKLANLIGPSQEEKN